MEIRSLNVFSFPSLASPDLLDSLETILEKCHFFVYFSTIVGVLLNLDCLKIDKNANQQKASFHIVRLAAFFFFKKRSC